MIVTGASVEDVELIVRAVSQTKYDGNVEIRDISDKSSRRTVRTSFTLRVKDGHAGSKGAKGSRGFESSGTGPHGLRCSSLSACWHVHYDVLETLFDHHPAVIVTTSMARYVAENFHQEAIKTAGINVGSQVQPYFSTELCECEHHTDDETYLAMGGVYYRARTSEITRQAEVRARLNAAHDSELGKYASGGSYEADLYRDPAVCTDCGCPA